MAIATSTPMPMTMLTFDATGRGFDGGSSRSVEAEVLLSSRGSRIDARCAVGWVLRGHEASHESWPGFAAAPWRLRDACLAVDTKLKAGVNAFFLLEAWLSNAEEQEAPTRPRVELFAD